MSECSRCSKIVMVQISALFIAMLAQVDAAINTQKVVLWP